ncbi:MAG TPA: hypothetical protein VHX66_02140 [Solirubrobacteraceae bacterium]|jgi:hypothetical protein|nr:hypothetical protein [Solirubrobacteraceae bacterium]
MTDVIHVLAATSPDVGDEPVPSIEDVWRKLDEAGTDQSDAGRSLRPSGGWWRRGTMRWTTVGATAVAAAVALLVVGTTGGGPANAFADWTATPTTPTEAQLQSAEAACQQESPALGSLTPTLSDFRGPNSLLVYAQSTTTTVCDTGNAPFPTMVSVYAADSTPVAAGAINPETNEAPAAIMATGQLFYSLAGRVGSGVTAVTLVLGDGTTVTATVVNGWFAAWWPANWNGGQPGQGGPIGHAIAHSAQVTTATGTTTQPLNWNSTPPTPESVNGTPWPPQTGATATSGATSTTTTN